MAASQPAAAVLAAFVLFFFLGRLTATLSWSGQMPHSRMCLQNALPDVLCVAQVALEGAISKQAALASLSHGTLPQVRLNQCLQIMCLPPDCLPQVCPNMLHLSEKCVNL